MARFPATLADLTGPWRPTPLLLDPLLWTRIEASCRMDMQFAPASRAVIIDARGAGVATVQMTGPMVGHCNALQVTPRGDVFGAGGGQTGPGPEHPALPPPADLGPPDMQEVGGGDLTVAGWSVHGQVGEAIASVIVEPRGRPPVQATVMNGWYSAWWPTAPGEVGPALGGPHVPPPGVIVRAYDAVGALLDELVR